MLIVSRFEDNDVAMLSARAHYINGVGHYENDSVVDACKEYLRTVDIMENHFEENELVGYKAKFMGLTYNRLAELFSGQFMMEQSIFCGKQTLKWCSIEPISKYGISSVLYRLGKQYHKMGNLDKADSYYTLAIDKLPDKTTLYIET